mgnify:CR=1 FL=1
MLKLLGSVESVKRTLDEESVRRAVQSFLGVRVSDTELHFLAQGAEIRSYAAGQVLFQQGDEADGLYLVRRGSVTVSRLLGGREIVLSLQRMDRVRSLDTDSDTKSVDLGGNLKFNDDTPDINSTGTDRKLCVITSTRRLIPTRSR